MCAAYRLWMPLCNLRLHFQESVTRSLIVIGTNTKQNKMISFDLFSSLTQSFWKAAPGSYFQLKSSTKPLCSPHTLWETTGEPSAALSCWRAGYFQQELLEARNTEPTSSPFQPVKWWDIIICSPPQNPTCRRPWFLLLFLTGTQLFHIAHRRWLTCTQGKPSPLRLIYG